VRILEKYFVQYQHIRLLLLRFVTNVFHVKLQAQMQKKAALNGISPAKSRLKPLELFRLKWVLLRFAVIAVFGSYSVLSAS